MNNKDLLEEIRILRAENAAFREETRSEFKALNKEINSVKIKLASFTSLVSTVFGIIGATVKDKFFS